MRSTRATIRPGSKKGATTLVFRLARSALVRFTVVRVFPACERVGGFRVRARAGVNRIKWRGRLRGKPLAEGTYRVHVRAGGARRNATVLTVVVVRGEPLTGAELHEARNANVCGTVEAAGGNGTGTAPARAASDDRAGGSTAKEKSTAAPAAAAGTIGRGARTLGARFTRLVEDPRSVHPLVWGALALSIFLLAVAAIPAQALVTARAAAVAYKRFEIGLVGTAALVASFLMYLISY